MSIFIIIDKEKYLKDKNTSITEKEALEYFKKCNSDLESVIIDEGRSFTIAENRTYQANKIAIEALLKNIKE